MTEDSERRLSYRAPTMRYTLIGQIKRINYFCKIGLSNAEVILPLFETKIMDNKKVAYYIEPRY